MRKMKINEKFERPEMKIIKFDAEDVIVTSGGCSGDCVFVCSEDCLSVTPA